MNESSRIHVAGHRGLVGSAIVRRLEAGGYKHLLLRTSQELDLRDPVATRQFFEEARPEYVFLAAARVGGILANSRSPVDFLADNLAIQQNVITSAHATGVTKLLFLGSSCIYPRECPQPIREEYLLSGPLERTNEWYAIAKIAGIKLCQAYRQQHGARFISAMPTNLYGPNDNFNLETSHVLPAMIRKFHDATRTGGPVTLWGSGNPRREFLHVDDLADACLFLMDRYEDDWPINVGTGTDVTIRELAALVARAVGYTGEVVWDDSKPDGTPRKWLDVSRLSELGWQARLDLETGLRETVTWYQANREE
jgi:GDP-L-fucose synthase